MSQLFSNVLQPFAWFDLNGFTVNPGTGVCDASVDDCSISCIRDTNEVITRSRRESTDFVQLDIGPLDVSELSDTLFI